VYQTFKQVLGFNKVQNVAVYDEQNSHIIYFQTDELKITNEGEAPLHIDGDPVDTTKELRFAVERDCFLLIYP
jgi:diacylglycerol kinase family enzyme